MVIIIEYNIKFKYFLQNKTIPGAKISGGILVIPNITSEATGLYTCIASNAIGSSRANIMLEATYGMWNSLFIRNVEFKGIFL